MKTRDVIALARELVALPSVTGDEGRVALHVADRLEADGWHVVRQEVPPETPGGAARYNVLAVDDPKIAPEVVLTTHLDTVPPFIAPTEDDQYLYGRGTCDAKGIFAAQWLAIERLRESGRKGLALLGIAGEETDSVGAKVAGQVLPRARWIIDGEPTELALTSAAKGILALKLTADGVAGHSAYPERGRSAAHAMIRALARLVDAKLPSLEEFGETTINVGVLSTGLAPNVIAPAASASVLIRLGASIDAVLAAVKGVIGPEIGVEVTSSSEPLRIHVPEGRSGSVVRFGSDVPYLGQLGTALLVGPGSIFDAHTSGEKISKRELAASVDLYVDLAETLMKGEGRAVSIYINRVYTKSGDRGTTRLAGGQERRKDDARLEAYGTVDELNAVLGLVAEEIARAKRGEDAPDVGPTVARLRRIQNELFDLGGELATLAEDRHPKQALVTDDDIARLEREMDAANEGLPALRSFILPGGGMESALLHQARTVCRRAERRLVTLDETEPQRGETVRYLNRLSDWLFVMGRAAAIGSGHGEVLWKPGDRG